MLERERIEKAQLHSRITELLEKLTESQMQITELTKTNAALVAQLENKKQKYKRGN